MKEEEEKEEDEEKIEENKDEDNLDSENILKEIEEGGFDSDEYKETEEKQDIQIKWIVFLMVSMIIIIIAVPFINKNFINNFDYKGLEFQKTKLGDLVLYSVKFPVVSVTGQVTGDYSMNFRNDPRELEEIPSNIPDNRVTFVKRSIGGYNPVYISLDPDMKLCEDTNLALINFAGFLRGSELDVRSATTNKTYAEKMDIMYKDCTNSPSDTIIRISSSDETSITKTMDNCYDIKYKECEIIEVTERFMLVMLEEYASKFQSV